MTIKQAVLCSLNQLKLITCLVITLKSTEDSSSVLFLVRLIIANSLQNRYNKDKQNDIYEVIIMSYYDWIIQYADKNNDYGELARIILQDEEFPKNLSSLSQLQKYIEEKSARRKNQYTAIDSFKEYEKEQEE